MQEYSTIAAVDLGSNSFRLQVGRVVDDQIYPLDSLKETVRLAAGLTEDKYLDDDSIKRALECLKRFGERLRGLPKDAVRVVGTNTLRVAKNAANFLMEAEEALGFPIEIIAGKEEARLIYLGVSHSLPPSDQTRLVVDIGGGSTEFIVGSRYKPKMMESLYMGCVVYSGRFFSEGKLGKSNLQKAELAARAEVQSITSDFHAKKWEAAVGSSGTAKSLSEIMVQNGWSSSGITAEGLAKLHTAMVRAGDLNKLSLPGLTEDRRPVLPGGLAIMKAVFGELGIQEMAVADGALREGVLYDLIGRFHHHDKREASVNQFMQRYHVDPSQARRVATLAEQFLNHGDIKNEMAKVFVDWAARLHEIGISISHSGYHKHSAYIVENADMPGFSKMEQRRLAALVRTHRGSLVKVKFLITEKKEWVLVASLRLAALFCRSRADIALPEMTLKRDSKGFILDISEDWLSNNPLTATLLDNEAQAWREIGIDFSFTVH